MTGTTSGATEGEAVAADGEPVGPEDDGGGEPSSEPLPQPIKNSSARTPQPRLPPTGAA
jgi:hypothetical protein